MTRRASDGDRCEQFRRQWRLVVMLRLNKLTIAQMANRLGVNARTVRRDLAMLRSVPLPILYAGVGNAADPRVFWVGSLASWPRNEAAPISVPLAVLP